MFVGAVQRRLGRLLFFLLLRRLPPKLGAFTHLPTEIVLIIARHLSNPSLLSLALTCRTLHRICFPQSLHLNKPEKEELLQLLEKDTPSLYFCHSCTNLHSWRTGLFSSIQHTSPCWPKSVPHVLPSPFGSFIPHHHARLVMNHHFYGPAHGIPVRKFPFPAPWTQRERRIREHTTEHARIVDDMLLFLSTNTMHHARGNALALRKYLDAYIYEVCRHLTLRAAPDEGPRRRVPELSRGATTAPDYFVCCEQSFGSCTSCLTDYCVDIWWGGRTEGYIVSVATYRQVGSCRSPLDWSYRTMGGFCRYGEEEPRTAHPVRYRPGVVRDRWNRGEGIRTVTESRWR